MEVELVELLLAVHLDDDEGDNEDEEAGAGCPRRHSGALQKAFGDVANVGCCSLCSVHDRGLGDSG